MDRKLYKEICLYILLICVGGFRHIAKAHAKHLAQKCEKLKEELAISKAKYREAVQKYDQLAAPDRIKKALKCLGKQ